MNESLVIVESDQLLSRIRGEYIEMPGLRLTRAQAQRLWALDEQTCAQLLEWLTADRFLYRRDDGTYARLSEHSTAFPQPRMARAERPEHVSLAARRPA